MTIKYTKSEERAIVIGNALVAGRSATATIDKECKAERVARKGSEVGTLATGDAFMVRIAEVLTKANWKEQTIKNALTTVRKAVNKGERFSLNPYRDATPKGAKVSKEGEKQNLNLSVKGEAKTEDVVKALRNLFNKMKPKEQYAELASFLIDALDEFEGQ